MKLGTTAWTLERTAAQATEADAELAGCVVPLYRIVRKLNDETETALRPLGLSQTEFEVLQTLHLAQKSEQFTLKDLNRALLFSSGGITKVIERLHADDLIDIEVDPADRRKRICKLTSEGRRLARRALKLVIAVERKIVTADLRPDDRRALVKVLGQITANIECNVAP